MPDSALKIRLVEDMKNAMRQQEKTKLGVIRLILAAIKQREVDTRKDQDDQQILGTLDKMLKQRRDSLSQFAKAGREDLVAQEQFELDLIKTYMPAELSAEEIDAFIAKAVADAGASSMRDMGKVMGQLKSSLMGRADMAVVSRKVKDRLSG
ncbi:MAG: GatB/YqeY domain-containing protein [Gammaproteobacteria bacterium]|nr:GatB/YqeY domain-containing protein [Gammaproteobacteria bacterium]